MKQNRRISGSAFNQNTKSNEGKIIYLVVFFLSVSLSLVSLPLSLSPRLFPIKEEEEEREGEESEGGERRPPE